MKNISKIFSEIFTFSFYAMCIYRVFNGSETVFQACLVIGLIAILSKLDLIIDKNEE